LYVENRVILFAASERRKNVGERPGRAIGRLLLIMRVFSLMIVLLFFPSHSRAQVSPHDHHPYHADFYSRWQRPNGMSCCSDRDCRPAKTRIRGQVVQVLIDGEWVDAPSGAIRPYVSPDLGDHVCAIGKNVLCVILGHGV
jgi:hypothetical protein